MISAVPVGIVSLDVLGADDVLCRMFRGVGRYLFTMIIKTITKKRRPAAMAALLVEFDELFPFLDNLTMNNRVVGWVAPCDPTSFQSSWSASVVAPVVFICYLNLNSILIDYAISWIINQLSIRHFSSRLIAIS